MGGADFQSGLLPPDPVSGPALPPPLSFPRTSCSLSGMGGHPPQSRGLRERARSREALWTALPPLRRAPSAPPNYPTPTPTTLVCLVSLG